MAFLISDECIGCGACDADCPVNCIDRKDNGQYKINPSDCVECGTCAGICPVSAISQA